MKKIIALIIFGIFLILLWVKIIDIREMFTHYQGIKWQLVLIAGLFHVSSIALRALRWHTILRRLVKVKILHSINYYFLGAFVDFLIPVRIGELIKSYKIKEMYDEPISKTVSTIFIDRLMDAFPVVFVIILLPFVQYEITGFVYYLITGLIMLLFFGLLVLILFLSYPDVISKILFGFLGKNRFEKKVTYLVNNFSDSLREIQPDFRLFLKIMSFSMLAILCNCFAFWIILKAFGDTTIPMNIAFFGYTLLFLSYILPAPPAQIGSNELFSILIFTGIFGYNKEYISAIILFFHSFVGFIMILIGISLVKHYHVNIKKFLNSKK